LTTKVAYHRTKR